MTPIDSMTASRLERIALWFLRRRGYLCAKNGHRVLVVPSGVCATVEADAPLNTVYLWGGTIKFPDKHTVTITNHTAPPPPLATPERATPPAAPTTLSTDQGSRNP